jgi:hypothetical protein
MNARIQEIGVGRKDWAIFELFPRIDPSMPDALA